MIRTLLTTTALAALLTSGAMAQAANTTTSTTATPAGGVLSPYTAVDSDNLATEIIGKQVYSSAAADAEHIGDINNLVVAEDGSVQAAVIGVGGFLGIGEKNVAVNMDQLKFVTAADNTERYVLETTKEALNAAPAFEWSDDQPAATAATTPAPASPNAPATDTAATTTPAPAADANAPATDTAAATTTAPAADANAPATETAAANPAPADNAAAPADETATGAVAPADTAKAPAAGTKMDPLNRQGYTDFDETQLTAEELIGTNVYGTNDEHIGTIGDLALNEDGSVDAIVIDFGGFLGIGTKPVAVAYENLDFLADPNNNRALVLPITREQMEAAPTFNKDTYTAERDTQRVVVGANAQT